MGRRHAKDLLVITLKWARAGPMSRDEVYSRVLQSVVDREELFNDPYDEVFINTRFSYLYTDGSNCKREVAVVAAGRLYFADIMCYLEDGSFIPGQIGLPEPQLAWLRLGYQFPTEHDHPYCTLRVCNVQWTDLPPTPEGLTADELKARFAATRGVWDEAAAWKRWALLLGHMEIAGWLDAAERPASNEPG